MSNITKHDTKQEWESYHCENSWVDFLVHGNTISVNDFLEDIRELVCLDVSRWLNGVVLESLEISGWILS